MNLKVTPAIAREAALIVWLDQEPEESIRERIRGELWCLRNGIDTTDLWDVTVHDVHTSAIIDIVMRNGPGSWHDNAALLLCTMSEIS